VTTLTVYVAIGNSDDKLTQARWNELCTRVHRAVFAYAEQVHGDWQSIGSAPYQNACLCFEIPVPAAGSLKRELAILAAEFGQDAIAWAEAVTEFIGPAAPKLAPERSG
jgi:hypothetical protein